jgi:hypothetical protein
VRSREERTNTRAGGERSGGGGAFDARMTARESYVEQPPLPGLAGVVRTVWIQ